MTNPTLTELADELGATIYQLMEFAPEDIPNTLTGDTHIDAETADRVRAAWNKGKTIEQAEAEDRADSDQKAETAGHHHHGGEACDPPATDASGR